MGYFDSKGLPLWFHIGSSSTDHSSFTPTVYTLWKRVFLPIVTTPQLVVDKMKQGADLMAPGVVSIQASHNASLPLSTGQLVCVAPYSGGLQGVPMAVGTMNMSSTEISTADKGKAVLTLHAYGDSLWEKGGKADPPKEIVVVQAIQVAAQSESVQSTADQQQPASIQSTIEENKEDVIQPQASTSTQDTVSPAEVDKILRAATLFALHAKAASIELPCSASAFYADSILPFRPAGLDPSIYVIKNSSFKKLKPFLKALEKEGVLKTKEMGGELHLMAIDSTHPDLQGAAKYRTIADDERKEAKARAMEEIQAASPKAMTVTELYKPVGSVAIFCKSISPDCGPHFTIVELRDEVLSKYITEHNLVHPTERAYFKVDETLKPMLLKKNESQEFLKRDEGLQRLAAACQAWYQIEQEGHPPELSKGKLHPIAITIKMRQGKKAVTLITNFEPFHFIADSMAEDLRKLCAAQTSVSPLQGKANQLEVMVQGKQGKIVTDYLLQRGVPKKWIEFEDTTEKKKGK